MCDDNLLVGQLPGNVATWLQHNGAGGKRTPLGLRSILSQDGVSGARGYCHVVFTPMDSCGEIRSVDAARALDCEAFILFSYADQDEEYRNHFHPLSASHSH